MDGLRVFCSFLLNLLFGCSAHFKVAVHANVSAAEHFGHGTPPAITLWTCYPVCSFYHH
jgi:hypothetical protein